MKKNIIFNNTFYCIKYIWAINPKYILLMLVISILTSAFNVINLSILRYITVTLMLDEIKWFLIVIFIMFLISIVISVINGSASYLIEPLLQNRIIEKIQGDIYEKAKKFNLEEFENEEFYNLYYFVVENGKDGIINSVTLTTGVLTSLLSIIGICGIVFQYDMVIIMLSIIGVSFSCICSMRMKKLQYKYKIDAIPYNREISYIHRIFYLNEYIKEILAFCNSNVFFEKYKSAWNGMNNKTKYWGGKIRKQYILTMLADSITETLILVYLGYETISGKMQLGEFVVLYTGIQQMIQQFKAAIASVPEIYSNALDLEKYFEFMNRNTDDENKVLISKVDRISFNNVSFSYNGEKEILQNINLALGGDVKKIALVGKNGSGKSSIIKLLMGFYNNYSGEIYINEHELRSVSRSNYRCRISILYQDFKLFSMTINQNAAMNYNATQNEKKKINDLLKVVKIYEKIQSLPQKNETILSKEFDKNGIYLSGGEQQKIGLVRSLVKDSDVLILDEPFSGVDNISKSMLKEIMDMVSGKIFILITHDYHELSGMDKIILLEDGKIVEEGTEKELLEYQGKFNEMWLAAQHKGGIKK